MFRSVVTLLFICLYFAHACPDHQKTEVNTTTAATATSPTTTPSTTSSTSTTTTTPAPQPCSTCTPIYQGPSVCISKVSSCLDSSAVGITYSRVGDVCSTTFTCPAGSTSKSTDPMGYDPIITNGSVTLTCPETGGYAGTWSLGATMVSDTTCGIP